jgi:hypothetical protein
MSTKHALDYDQVIKLLTDNKWNVIDNDSVADLFRLVRAVEKAHGIDEEDEADEAKDALENIEAEIIARACRNGVCED